jgi:hypothetical protein
MDGIDANMFKALERTAVFSAESHARQIRAFTTNPVVFALMLATVRDAAHALNQRINQIVEKGGLEDSKCTEAYLLMATLIQQDAAAMHQTIQELTNEQQQEQHEQNRPGQPPDQVKPPGSG